MPGPRGQELGVRSPFSVRVGLTHRRFRGTNTRGDAGSIADDEFWALENVQHDGSKWNSRDGLAKVNSGAAMTGTVYGMWDEEDDRGFGAGVRIYGGVNNGAATLIYAYDSALTEPTQQILVNPQEATFGAALGIHEEFDKMRPADGDRDSETEAENTEARLLLGGKTGRVYAWTPVKPPEGKTLLNVAPRATLLLQCPDIASDDAVTALLMWAGVLYIATAYGSGTGAKIFSYDGSTVTLEDTQAGKSTGILGVYQGEVFAAFNSQLIRRRSAAGTWSSVTFPGTVTAYIPRQIIEYGTALYFAGTDGTNAKILKWDGTSLTSVRTLTGATSGALLAMEVFSSKLCYLWKSTA